MAMDGELSKVKHRCHPFKVLEMFAQLSGIVKERRIQLLKDCGFGGIIKMTECNSLPGFFVKWVTNRFDNEHCRLQLGRDRHMDVMDTDVERVYGLPRGRLEIKLQKLSLEDINQFRVEIGLQPVSKHCKNIPMPELKELLINQNDDNKWIKLAIWFIISNLLCPKSHDVVSLKYGPILKDITLLKNFNWCQHILDYMKKGIRKGASYSKGDFYFLMVNYMDKMGRTSSLSTGNFDTPTCGNYKGPQKKDEMKKIHNLVTLDMGILDERFISVTEKDTDFLPTILPDDPNTCRLDVAPKLAERCLGQIKLITTTYETLRRRMEEAEVNVLDETVGWKAKLTREEPAVGNKKRLVHMRKISDEPVCKQKRVTKNEENIKEGENVEPKVELPKEDVEWYKSISATTHHRTTKFEMSRSPRRAETDKEMATKNPQIGDQTQKFLEENIELFDDYVVTTPKTALTRKECLNEIIDIEDFERDIKGKKHVVGALSRSDEYVMRKSKPSRYFQSPYEKHLDECALHPLHKNLLSFAFSATLDRDEMLYRMENPRFFSLYRSDLWTLNKDQLLTSVVLDCWTNILNWDQMKNSDKIVRRLYLSCDSSFHSIRRYKSDPEDRNRTDAERADAITACLQGYGIDSAVNLKIWALDYIYRPVVLKDHFITFCMNVRNKTFEYLTSLPEIKRVNSNKTTGTIEATGRWLMREACCFVNALHLQQIGMQSTLKFDQFEWCDPVLPKQADGWSCGPMTMKYLEQWRGDPNDLDYFYRWDTASGYMKKKRTTEMRAELAVQILEHDSNMRKNDLQGHANVFMSAQCVKFNEAKNKLENEQNPIKKKQVVTTKKKVVHAKKKEDEPKKKETKVYTRKQQPVKKRV